VVSIDVYKQPSMVVSHDIRYSMLLFFGLFDSMNIDNVVVIFCFHNYDVKESIGTVFLHFE